ncbi:hypothetical protein DV515_00006186 [Chloebia gouldiae]|uniref:Uncharacterized protein n=1 Tax=Chloebia gouldiae TaxID=44316 RepID=A0A3L8SLN3_CHLGU|nr:hypothetical protein DV515_00006186 [Chloebia gouldiae]
MQGCKNRSTPCKESLALQSSQMILKGALPCHRYFPVMFRQMKQRTFCQCRSNNNHPELYNRTAKELQGLDTTPALLPWDWDQETSRDWGNSGAQRKSMNT